MALKNLHNNKQPELFNLGISGDTTQRLLARIGFETKARKWPGGSQIAVVAIGTNDDVFEGGKQRKEPAELRTNIQKIIMILKPLVDGILFVGNIACDEELTTPVFWADIHYTNERMQKHEQIIQDVALEQEIAFVPVFKIKRAANHGL